MTILIAEYKIIIGRAGASPPSRTTAANSDRRIERRRERRAAESSEQGETRLARRCVADRARFAAICR